MHAELECNVANFFIPFSILVFKKHSLFVLIDLRLSNESLTVLEKFLDTALLVDN